MIVLYTSLASLDYAYQWSTGRLSLIVKGECEGVKIMDINFIKECE